MPRGRNLWLTLLSLALVAGAVAAFAQTQLLKLERASVRPGRFDPIVAPLCGCPRETATLRLRLDDAERLDATVVDEDDDPVRTLASGEERDAGIAAFVWDGRDAEGRPVPEGAYRLRIDIPDRDRSILLQKVVEVTADRRPPAP